MPIDACNRPTSFVLGHQARPAWPLESDGVRCQDCGLQFAGLLSAILGLEVTAPLALVRPLPHTLGLARKRCEPVRVAAEALLDLATAE